MKKQTIDKSYRLRKKISGMYDSVKRAFVEFLTLPTFIITGFLALAVISYLLDYKKFAAFEPFRAFLESHVFANPKATSDLLGAIAAGIIAVTSITITLLLIVAQQSAASMTSQVFDQFLRRRTNQLYFSFFVGLALYALITLATVNDPFNPVFGGTLAFALTVAALYLLVILIYTTINQMRPVEIIEAIHEHILGARKRELEIISRTRRRPISEKRIAKQIKCEKHGYVTGINVEKIGAAIKDLKDEAELILKVSIGSFVAFQDLLAEVKTNNETESEIIYWEVLKNIRIDRQRDIDFDASYGIEQLEMIAWTSISTSKSNPAPGFLTIRSLRDVMARWSHEESGDRKEIFPIVYADKTPDKLMDAFETFAVVSSESMQHQNYIEVILTFTVMFDRLPPKWQTRAENLILRILSVLGDFALTAELDKSLSGLVDKLALLGKNETALAVTTAQKKLQSSIGKLNSRSTRAAGK